MGDCWDDIVEVKAVVVVLRLSVVPSQNMVWVLMGLLVV